MASSHWGKKIKKYFSRRRSYNLKIREYWINDKRYDYRAFIQYMIGACPPGFDVQGWISGFHDGGGDGPVGYGI